MNVKDDYEVEGSKLYQLTQELDRNYQMELALKECHAEAIYQELKTQNNECRWLYRREW